jgi:hypothetical protein
MQRLGTGTQTASLIFGGATNPWVTLSMLLKSLMVHLGQLQEL